MALGGEQTRCLQQGIIGVIGGAKQPVDCKDFYKMLEAHSRDDGMVGKVARSMTEAPEGMYVVRPGSFTNVKPPAVRLAEVRAGKCFTTERYSVGDRALYSVTEMPRDGISLADYMAHTDAAARNVAEAATPADRPGRLPHGSEVMWLPSATGRDCDHVVARRCSVRQGRGAGLGEDAADRLDPVFEPPRVQWRLWCAPGSTE